MIILFYINKRTANTHYYAIKIGGIILNTRADVVEDVIKLLEIITTYKVLKLEQLYYAIKKKEYHVKQAIIKKLEKQDRIFIKEGIVSSEEKWTKKYDPSVITAFWVLLDFWEEVLFNTSARFPAKIEFITNDDAYDIIVVEQGQENMFNAFFNKLQHKSIRHIIAVESFEQMDKLKIPDDSVFCIVKENGSVSYYRKEADS